VLVDGHIVSALRYADDKAVVASTQKEMQNLMDRLNTVTKKYGMKIKVKKTKVMCVSRTRNHKLKILIEGQRVEQVTQFKYYDITEDRTLLAKYYSNKNSNM